VAVGVGRADKRLVEAALTFEVEPGQPAAHGDLPRRLIDHREIHELGHSRIGGAARALVGGNDQIGEDPDRPVFGRREELRRVGDPGPRGRLPRCLHEVMGLLRLRLGQREAGRDRRGRQDLEQRATVDVFH
jgi:hypothetical protein